MNEETVDVKCQCGVDIMKKTKDKNEFKVRTKILLLDDSGFLAVCKKCGNEIKISNQLNMAQELIGHAKSS